MGYALVLLFTLLTGCINIDTHMQPVDAAVKPTLAGDDCSPIILGFGFGTNTFEAAKVNGEVPREIGAKGPRQLAPIRLVRSVVFQERAFLAFGLRCLEVMGEP